MVWFGLIVLFGFRLGWSGLDWLDFVWFGLVWFGRVGFDLVWVGLVCRTASVVCPVCFCGGFAAVLLSCLLLTVLPFSVTRETGA